MIPLYRDLDLLITDLLLFLQLLLYEDPDIPLDRDPG